MAFNPRAGLQSLRNVGSAGRFGPIDWEDAPSVTREVERLKERNREINMGANPAFGGTGGMGTSSFALTPEMAKAGGNTNVEFWENNEQIRALEDLQRGGVGSGWRRNRAPEVVGPGGESRQSIEYRNARAAAQVAPQTPQEYGDGDGGGGMGQGLAALQRQTSAGRAGLSDRDLAARMGTAATREAEARAAAAEAATPRGQREAAEAGMNQTIANLRTGRTGYVAGGMTDIETGVAGQQAMSARDIAQRGALSQADTYFMDPIAAQRGAQQALDLEKIRAAKVEPAAMAGDWRAIQEGIRQEGLGARGQTDAQSKLLVSLLNDFTRMSTSMSISPEDRSRAIEGANAIKAYLQSLGVNLTGGGTAAGPPIR